MLDTRLIYMPLAYFDVIGNSLLCALCCYLCYLFQESVVYSPPKYLDVKTITAACLVASFFFHPGVKNEYFLTVQMLVSFSMFMECAGLVPQLLMMLKAKEVEVLTSHYVMLLMISRVFRLCFWVKMYFDGAAFIVLNIADVIHTVMLADFALLYFKSRAAGAKLLLP